MTKAASKSPKRNGAPRRRNEAPAISALRLCGYKSFVDESIVAIRPLTVLAGANSSGKSSAIEPLLLLKQTIESGLDPGPLLVDGPNVDVGSGEQILSKYDAKSGSGRCMLGVELANGALVRNQYILESALTLGLFATEFGDETARFALPAKGRDAEIRRCLPRGDERWSGRSHNGLSVERLRWYLAPAVDKGHGPEAFSHDVFRAVGKAIGQVIHVPAARWLGKRSWPVVAADQEAFPGTFQDYLPSVLLLWRNGGDDRFAALQRAMCSLGLASWIDVFARDDARLSVKVGRRIEAGVGETLDTVNIADVGTGVGSALVVVAALLVAKPGQTVYIDQPELHLHPRAQVALADILVQAALRGVRAIVETHSELLLLSVQTLVAQRTIQPEQVALHWFRRDPKSGCTSVEVADLDERGTFGDWPADFGDVALSAQSAYLRAARKAPSSRSSR